MDVVVSFTVNPTITPANTRQANIKTALGQRLAFAGTSMLSCIKSALRDVTMVIFISSRQDKTLLVDQIE